MPEFIAVLCITILAVISPGADFAIVTKNSYLYGRHIGILTALGIALAVLVHVSYTLIALHWAFHSIPEILNIIRYIGSVYLIYIGYKTFTQPITSYTTTPPTLSRSQAFKNGFLTNVLNPKTTLFVISTYTQIISTATSLLVSYGLFMSFTHFIWFAIVSLVFSQPTIRQRMLAHQQQINRGIGIILVVLGLLLLLSHLY